MRDNMITKRHRSAVDGGTSRSTSRSLTMDAAVSGLFAALIAIGAFMKIVIPVGVDTMNFTLQWLFVLLAGLLLGSRRASRSVATYLITGLIGFPIFARGGGPAYLLRPTFGFLLGFAIAAWVMGFLSEKLHPSKVISWFWVSLAGYAVYYGMGILYFYMITHLLSSQTPTALSVIFGVYCLPTMLPDLMLCVLAIMIAGRLRPVVQASLNG
ncbi:biotin transporter BioY [Clostridium sp. OF09-36]|uniref:biotin transporter BioY n=1 Tax=Clostridium sp. OF09-36 TaxID=2292310 RepID=UPI00325ADDED